MDEKKIAELAINFMERVELKGAEVQAYALVRNWLESKRSDEPVPEDAVQ